MEIDSDIITILIFTVRSVMVAGLFFIGGKISQWWKKRKIFLKYKGYALEFLKRYEKSLNTGCITFYDDNYKKEELSFKFINGKDDECEMIEHGNMPTAILAVLAGEKYLSNNDIELLCTILTDMCQKDKWLNKFYGRNYKGKKIKGTDLILTDKNNNILVELTISNYIYSHANVDKISNIFLKLRYKEFDEKIKKIIDRELEKNNAAVHRLCKI